MKKFISILLLVALTFCFTSCAQPSPGAAETPLPEETPPDQVNELPDLFIHGDKVYDAEGKLLDNYTVDEDHNILNLDGNIVIPSADTRELSAPMTFEKIIWDDNEVLNKDAEELELVLIAHTEVAEDGSYEPFRDEYTVQVFLDNPDVDFKEVEFKHDDATENGNIYKFIIDDKDEESIKVEPTDGAYSITFVVTEPGEQEMILENAFEEEICRIKLNVVLPQPLVSEEDPSEEQGSAEGKQTHAQQQAPSGSQDGQTSAPSQTQAPAVTLCNHNWIPVYEQVVHPAEYDTIHHDAVYEEQQVYVVDQPAITATEESVILWCARCGQTYVQCEHGGLSDSAANAAILAHCLECDSNYFFKPGTNTYTVQEEVGHYETQQVCTQAAYDEDVLIKQGWAEEVLAGYYCSICGSTK